MACRRGVSLGACFANCADLYFGSLVVAGRDPVTGPGSGRSKPVQVFVLAGQSNMEGQAVVDLDGPDYNGGRERWFA